MKTQKIPNSQVFRKKSQRNQSSWLQIILQSYNNENSRVMAQKQIYR